MFILDSVETSLIALFSKQDVFTKYHGLHLGGPAGHAVYPPVEEDHHHHRREEGPDCAVEDVTGVTKDEGVVIASLQAENM